MRPVNESGGVRLALHHWQEVINLSEFLLETYHKRELERGQRNLGDVASAAMVSLDLAGEIAGRVLTRMAEVLEGRHTDAEIASADVMQIRDMSADDAEATKRRIAQHALFVQIDGSKELIDYLLRNIELSPSAYAPSGASP